MKGKRQISRTLISCLVTAIVPLLLLGSFFIAYQYSTEKQRLQDDMLRRVELACSAYEQMIDNVQSAATHFSAVYADGSVSTIDDIEKQFSAYTDSFGLIGKLYFYERGQQQIISADGMMPYSTFESATAFGAGLNSASFYTRINTLRAPVYLAVRGSEDRNNFTICIYPVPLLSASPKGILFYALNDEAVTESMHNWIGDYEGFFSIFDGDRRLIYSESTCSRHDEASAASSMNLLHGIGMQHLRIGGEAFVSARVISEKRNFAYTMSIPTTVLYRELNRTICLYALCMLVLLSAAIIISVCLARWQAKPIYQLARMVDPSLPEDATLLQANSLDAIGRRFNVIQRENDKLVLQASSYMAQSRTRLFTDLISGTFHDPASVDEAARACGITFDYPAFMVLVTRLDAANSADAVEEALDLFGEADFRDGRAYAFDTGMPDQLGIIINVNDKGVQDTDLLRLDSTQLFLSKLTALGWTPAATGVSRVRHSVLRINQQVFEAYAALSLQSSGINLFSQSPSVSESMPFQECELFRQSLLYGNEPAAMKTLDHLMKRIASEHWSTDLAQSVCFQLVHTLMMLYAGRQAALDSTDLTLAASAAQPEMMTTVMAPHISALCQMIVAQKQAADRSGNKKLVNYIYEHFADTDLSIESAAAHFGLSESNVRRMIRDATGTTFLNYVTTLRLSYVKKQLAETATPIREIVENAGYIDVSSFTRKFKAMEGVTPGQYRDATNK